MKIAKELIHDACIQKQNELIDGFTSRLRTMESATLEHDHSPSQTESRTAGTVELVNALGRELEFAQREMEFLKNLNPSKETDIVEPGAVVVTDKLTFYICVSIEKFEVNGKDFFGISYKAPIYASMRGLKKGTSFKYNETEYKILDVY